MIELNDFHLEEYKQAKERIITLESRRDQMILLSTTAFAAIVGFSNSLSDALIPYLALIILNIENSGGTTLKDVNLDIIGRSKETEDEFLDEGLFLEVETRDIDKKTNVQVTLLGAVGRPTNTWSIKTHREFINPR